MADTKISAETTASALTGAEQVPVVQGGANFKTTIADIRRGLWSGSLSLIPTSSNTGLSTWLNQGTASVSDAASGVFIDAPSAGTFSLKGRTKAAPSTPYTVTALVSMLGSANGSYVGIGWYDGTNKLHIVGLNIFSGTWTILSAKLNTPTSYNGNDTSLTWMTAPFVYPIWLQISDDGTNVTFRYGVDGANFKDLNTIAKASGFLGSSGYSNIVYFGIPENGAIKASLMSYAQT